MTTQKYAQHLSGGTTPQTAPLPGRTDMILNNAGGFVFQITPMQRLVRFLTTGAEGSSVNLLSSDQATYYQTSRELTVENAVNVIDLTKTDGLQLVDTIVEVSTAVPARVPKMDPAIFCLAVCFAYGDKSVKARALAAVPLICRIPTHLFKFVGACKELGVKTGGRAFKRALSNWYLDRSDKRLAYHLIKYQSREGFTNRDIFRICHPKARTPIQNNLIRWSVTNEAPQGDSEAEVYLRAGDELLRGDVSPKRAVQLITEFKFTHEMVPTALQKHPEIWEALLEHMPMTALIRNLGRMTSLGLLTPLSDSANKAASMLTKEAIIGARVHPMNILVAHRQYRVGRGLRGNLTWQPNSQVLAALDAGFYEAFGSIEPTGKRHMIALDISGSMGGGQIMGIPGFTPYEAEAALCMVPLRTEPRTFTIAFETKVTPIPLHSKQSLDDAYAMLRSRSPNMGRTDCAAPMVYALEKKIPVDVFIVYTDNETYYGQKHPSIALKEYRQAMGIDAKLVVNSLTATCSTIADPQDRGMLDISGFDSSQPQIVRQFTLGL